MSDSDIENFVRINRPELVADTNLKQAGSLNVSIVNPVQKEDGAYLLSRVGGLDTGDGRKPVSGYCVKFDVNNQNVFIQTNISSTNALDNWNITIKGEGTVDVLYVDTTGDYLAIKQKQALTGSDYFNLSYIAFVSRTSGKIEHLFECEENSGLYLYDAITGDTAFFTTDGTTAGVSSLTDLRSSATSKEWIRDEGRNLGNELAFNGGQATGTSSTIYQGFPVSFVCTFEATKEELDKLISATSNTDLILLWIADSGSNRLDFGFTKRTSSIGAFIALCNGSTQANQTQYRGAMTTTNLSGKHTLTYICRAFDTTTKTIDYEFRIDNESITLSQWSTSATTNIFTPEQYKIAVSNYVNGSLPHSLTPNFKLSRPYFFNFDISANDAPYTIQDYQNGKDVPSELLKTGIYSSAIDGSMTPSSTSISVWTTSIINGKIRNTK